MHNETDTSHDEQAGAPQERAFQRRVLAGFSQGDKKDAGSDTQQDERCGRGADSSRAMGRLARSRDQSQHNEQEKQREASENDDVGFRYRTLIDNGCDG